MALEGKIKDFGITDILQLIGMQKKTGIVTLTSNQDAVTITFEEGQIVAAESFKKWKRHLLGEVLVQAELLTEEDRDRALAMQKETGQRFGHILVHEGMVEAEELSSVIQLQVRETVFRVLEWKEGDYRFEQVPVAYDRENMHPIPCEQILMQAMQITDEWPRIRKVISSYSLVYEKSGTPGAGIGNVGDPGAGEAGLESSAAGEALDRDFPLSRTEERIYRLVDGRRSMQNLIAVSRVGEFETCKALYNLLSTGLIRPAGEAVLPTGEAIRGASVSRWTGILKNVAAAVLFVGLLGLLMISARPGEWVVLGSGAGLGRRITPLTRLRALQQMERITFAVKVYFDEVQSPVTALQELVQTGVLEEGALRDPWGTPYQLARETGRMILWSPGPDRKKGTADDLQWERFFPRG